MPWLLIRRVCVLLLALCPALPLQGEVKIAVLGGDQMQAYEVPTLLQSMLLHRGLQGRVLQAIAPGATLDDHIRGLKGLQSMRMVTEEKPTFVVVQEAAEAALGDTEGMVFVAGKMSTALRQAGSEPVFVVPFPPLGNDRNRLKLIDAYQELEGQANVAIAPVAQAWQIAAQHNPSLKLYADRGEPSAAGAYLTACVLYSCLTGTSPEGLPRTFQTKQDDGSVATILSLSENDALFCQRVAIRALSEVGR